MHFQYIHSLKIDSSAQSFSEPFTENSFYGCTRKLDRRLRDKMGYILASAFLTFIVSEWIEFAGASSSSSSQDIDGSAVLSQGSI